MTAKIRFKVNIDSSSLCLTKPQSHTVRPLSENIDSNKSASAIGSLSRPVSESYTNVNDKNLASSKVFSTFRAEEKNSGLKIYLHFYFPQ